ncbi:MAG: nitroreductase family protein [Clostridia bacterium]|jgi:nitroreductase|nr:nitroreductase [Clostridiaceae bacterium]
MDVMTAIKGRRSVRSYLPKEVEPEKLKAVLEAARLAPSARNLQNWKFIAVTDKNTIRRLTEACNNQTFVGEAPVFIAACALKDYGNMGCGIPRHIVDVSIAMTHMILEAYEQGLGTCWIGSFQQDKVKEILNIPEEAVVVAVTPLGYPAKETPPRPRKSFEEVVSFESF